MTITPSMILTWRSETASTMPETSTIWRDLSDAEKLALLTWLARREEKDVDKIP